MTQNSSKTMLDSKSSNGVELFKPLSQLRTVFIEGNKVLIENDSVLYCFLCLMFLLGIGILFFSLLNISIVYKIVLGLSLVFIALFLILRLDYYSVLDLSEKSFHKELRVCSLPIFKSKSIYLADIAEFGTDHKRKLAYDAKIPLIVTDFFEVYLDVGFLRCYLKGKKYFPCKKPDNVDGMVEKSAVAYLFQNGQIGYLNSFSGRKDADEINSALVEVLGDFTDKPAIVVDSNVGLSVKKMGSKYKLEPSKLKPVMIGGDFATTVLIFSIIFLIALIVFILLYFEIL